MEQQTVTPAKPKRLVRKRRTDLQLEATLREITSALEHGADASVLNLLRAKLTVLNQRLHREEHERFRRAIAEADRLRIENERLKTELAQALSQIESQRRPPVSLSETLEDRTARLLKAFDTSGRALDGGTF